MTIVEMLLDMMKKLFADFIPWSVVAMSAYLTKNLLFRETIRENKIAKQDLAEAQEQAKTNPLGKALEVNYKYLNQYYQQTQAQARNGFVITVIVAVIGIMLIFGGVWFMLFSSSNGDNHSDAITPAYITCASGVITEFISAIFFYLYNKTVTSMNSYHDKLVLSQNISFALNLAESLPEDKQPEAKLAIINELVKDVNAQMMKSDADTDEPPKKDKPSDNETPS